MCVYSVYRALRIHCAVSAILISSLARLWALILFFARMDHANSVATLVAEFRLSCSVFAFALAAVPSLGVQFAMVTRWACNVVVF